MKEIKRDLYLNKLIDRRENGSIKVITGIRRCGKSYLLFNLYYRYLLESGVPAERIIRIALMCARWSTTAANSTSFSTRYSWSTDLKRCSTA